jgi:NADH-quinone oxidoreductase subunit I
MEVIMLAPKIDIDYVKCKTPFDCKKCLVICPQAIFDVRPMMMKRGEELNKREPGTYKLFTAWRDRCTGCMDCVNICPVGALKITIPQEVIK